MADTKLDVTVSGGIAPVTIQVRFFKDGQHEFDISSSKSFSHRLIGLTTGIYDIYIDGFNPVGGSTTCAIDTSQINLIPPDDTPDTENGVSYHVEFHFTVV